MSSGFDFGAAGVCVICFNLDDSWPPKVKENVQLFVDDNGDTWDICVECEKREQSEIAARAAENADPQAE